MENRSVDKIHLEELHALNVIPNEHLHAVRVLDEVDVGLGIAHAEPLETSILDGAEVQSDVFHVSAEQYYFQTRLQQLQIYKEMNGHCNVPMDYDLQPGLGEWLHLQRHLYYKWLQGDIGAMGEEDRLTLMEIGVDLSLHIESSSSIIEPLDDIGLDSNIAVAANDSSAPSIHSLSLSKAMKWEARLSQLRAYKELYGHCNVPRVSKKNPEYNSLGEWCHFQRRLKNKGINSISHERIDSLNEIGFEWSRRNKRISGGDTTKEKPKRQRVAGVTNSQEESNNYEIEHSRAARGKEPSDYPNNKARLKEHIWQQHFSKLTEFKLRFGHCNIPRKWEENSPLGEWCHFQRRQYRLWTMNLKNHMTEERIQLLNNIGFEWTRNHSRQMASSLIPLSAIRDKVAVGLVQEPDGDGLHLEEREPLMFLDP